MLKESAACTWCRGNPAVSEAIIFLLFTGSGLLYIFGAASARDVNFSVILLIFNVMQQEQKGAYSAKTYYVCYLSYLKSLVSGVS